MLHVPRVGRPPKPYRPTWGGDPINGLYRCRDGRWRIVATGEKFTCHDELKAIARFRDWELQQQVGGTLVQFTPRPPADIEAIDAIGTSGREAKQSSDAEAGTEKELVFRVPEKLLWAYVRDQLIERPAYVAQMTDLPQLASFAHFAIPRAPVRIAAIITSYRAHSGSSKRSQQEAVKAFVRLVKHAGAKTLADLTDEKLTRFRLHLLQNPNLKSSGTIAAYFNRIRSVLSLSRRGTLDTLQIDAVLARCRTKLYPPENNVEDNPRPISRENFHKLLRGCDHTNIPEVWRAMLLLGLNCALYMEDICDLKWSMFDLERRTFVARRKKRGRCIRCAVLWDETVAGLEVLPRRGECPYVFVSTHGTRYNKNTKINDFKDFREKVGVPDVTFSHLRDGAYTAASHNPDVADKYARLLNGHKTQGLVDKYVARHPQIVKPACDAVYQHYFG